MEGERGGREMVGIERMGGRERRKRKDGSNRERERGGRQKGRRIEDEKMVVT